MISESYLKILGKISADLGMSLDEIRSMLEEGVSPTDARAVWDALFIIAQGGDQSAY